MESNLSNTAGQFLLFTMAACKCNRSTGTTGEHSPFAQLYAKHGIGQNYLTTWITHGLAGVTRPPDCHPPPSALQS